MDVDAAIRQNAGIAVDEADGRAGSNDAFQALGGNSSGHEQLLQGIKSYIVYSAARKRLSRRVVRIPVSVCDGRRIRRSEVARRREVAEVEIELLSSENLRHKMSGCGSKQDAIAVMPGGGELV